MKWIVFLFIAVLLFATSQATAKLEDDLVIYFTFDKVKDNKILDVSGNDLHADVVANVDFIRGKYGNAIHIAAAAAGDDCVNIRADNLLKIRGEITMMAWVYHEEWEKAWGSWLDRGSQNQVNQKRSYSMGFFESHIEFKGPKIGMILGGGLGTWKFITSGPMENKKWHHIAGTYDGKIRRIYLDGEIRSAGEDNFKFTGTNDSDLRIGCAVGHPGYTFRNGSIDEVGIWRRALTQAEIAEAMEGFLTVSPKDKVATTWAGIKQRAIIYR